MASEEELDDSDLDLDDVPLNIPAMAPNGRYDPHDEPLVTSRAPASGFSRLGPGFALKLPTPVPDDRGADSSGSDGLAGMRSEPVYMPETSRGRPVPGLGLALTQAARAASYGPEDAAPPRTRRAPPLKPPMLHLANPASASPVPSGAPTPGLSLPRDTPDVHSAGPGASASAAGGAVPVHVELLSSAFVLQNVQSADDSEEASTSQRVAQRCSSQLGIAPCDLQFYELRHLEGGVIPDACTHVGITIRGSTFSLSALEDMLARSKRDAQLASLLETAHRDAAQHAAEAKENAERAASQAAELAQLKERLRGLEAENQHLREQLKRADEHRHALGGTLRTMKKEFEDLKGMVVTEGAAANLSLQQLSLGASGGRPASGHGHAPAPGGPTGSRPGAGPR